MNRIGLILLVLALWFGCASTGQTPQAGEYAPDFNLVDVSGNEVKLSDFKGCTPAVTMGRFYQNKDMHNLQEKNSASSRCSQIFRLLLAKI